MLVKACIGDGRWKMQQVPSEVGLEWSQYRIRELCDENGNLTSDFDLFGEGSEFPDAESAEVHLVEGAERCSGGSDEPTSCYRFFRWVMWDREGDGLAHLLVTDGPIFICNNQGDTVEALR